MTSNEPFLLLISPSVADVGHAYVIADSVNQPSSQFGSLLQQCDFLQTLALLDAPTACLTVNRPVIQWSTSQRDAQEFLVCSAFPEDTDLAEQVKLVMKELWSQVYDVTNEASATWLKKAAQHQGSVFKSPRMTEITQAFLNHSEISDIAWRTISPAPARTAPHTPKLRHHMKFLVLLGGLAALAVAVVSKMTQPSVNGNQPKATVAPVTTQSVKSWNEWNEVLSGDDRLKKVLEETGGKKAYQAWAVAKDGAHHPDSKPDAVKKPEDQTLQLQQDAAKKLEDWGKNFGEEFAITDTSAKSVCDAPMTKYLKLAEPPWHRNINNQINQQGPELSSLKTAGVELEEFNAILGKFASSHTPGYLRTIWNALEAYSKSSPNDEVKPFQEVVKRELADTSAPPNDFGILTLKDAGRVNRLKAIFGSAEFGLVVAGRPFQKEDRWPLIKKSLDSATHQIGQMSGPERALLTTLKSTFDAASSGKPTPIKSP